MWDHLYAIVLINIGFYLMVVLMVGAGVGYIALLSLFMDNSGAIGGFLATLFILLTVHVVYNVYAGTCACVTRDIANYQSTSFQQFFQYLRDTWKSNAIYGVIQGAVATLFANAARFYLAAVDNPINPFIFFFITEIYIVWLIASQYYLPLQALFDKKVKKNVRKMFLLLFDNTAFTLFGLTLITILASMLSVFTFLLLPGLGAVLLLQTVSLKLRMLKYDYLEVNPEANRKKIPWAALLIDEQEKVGKRTLRGMFFPWKE